MSKYTLLVFKKVNYNHLKRLVTELPNTQSVKPESKFVNGIYPPPHTHV